MKKVAYMEAREQKRKGNYHQEIGMASRFSPERIKPKINSSHKCKIKRKELEHKTWNESSLY